MRGLSQYNKDDPNNKIENSESFKYKILLINCEIKLKLIWSASCVIYKTNRATLVAGQNSMFR